jgi:hypothetical protein
MGNQRKPGDPDKGAESDRGIHPAKNFDSLEPFSVRGSPMDSGHKLVVCFAHTSGIEIGRTDVRKTDSSTPIPALQEADFPPAQRTVAVEKNFDGMFG